MSFFTPLFLLGVLAVVGPIIFHLIRRTTREVTPFSSLMFLQPTPPRVTRRSRLENIWLLILRCLVIALLALAFARPFFQRESPATTPPPGAEKRRVLLVDTSASMRREQLWDQARRAVGQQLRDILPTDEVALLTFDRSVQTLVSFEDWKKTNPGERTAVAAQKLASLSPGWDATHLDRALLGAAELLEDPGKNRAAVRREIVLISDLQEGGRLDALQGYEWPAGLEVVLHPLSAQHLGNASAHWIAGDEAETADESSLRVRVSVTAESKRDQFQLRWQAGRSAPLDVYVPAGQSRIVRVPPAPGVSRLSLTGDGIEFDNTLHILPTPSAQLSVIFLGADVSEDPGSLLYFLRRAFPKTSRQNVEILADQTASAVPAFQLQKAQLLILGESVSEAALGSARQFAADGKMVLLPLASAAGAEALARLFQLPQLSASEAVVKDYGLLTQIDFQHPLFALFADPRFSDFTKVSFWKWRRLDPGPLPGAQIVARFDNSDPAIIQVPLGKGSVVIFTTTWRPKDSQLALSSKFVPLLNSLLEQSANFIPQKAQYFVGDELALRPDAQTVRIPDGTDIPLAAGAKFSRTAQPGIYTVNPGATTFVVNLAPEESRTTPWPPERFTSLGVPIRKMIAPVPVTFASDQARARAADLESRQKVWRWVILAALGVLLLETLFAGRLSRVAVATQP